MDCTVWSTASHSSGVRLAFECDDPVYNFTVEADKNGRFVYPTGQKAGGAPAGTIFRVKTEPVAQVVKIGTDGKVVEVISTEPAGTKIDVKQKDGKMQTSTLNIFGK